MCVDLVDPCTTQNNMSCYPSVDDTFLKAAVGGELVVMFEGLTETGQILTLTELLDYDSCSLTGEITTEGDTQGAYLVMRDQIETLISH